MLNINHSPTTVASSLAQFDTFRIFRFCFIAFLYSWTFLKTL